MANLALSAYQRRIAEQFGIEPGAEMRAAAVAAKELDLPLQLIDRDLATTLKRSYARVPWYKRLYLMAGLAFTQDLIKIEIGPLAFGREGIISGLAKLDGNRVVFAGCRHLVHRFRAGARNMRGSDQRVLDTVAQYLAHGLLVTQCRCVRNGLFRLLVNDVSGCFCPGVLRHVMRLNWKGRKDTLSGRLQSLFFSTTWPFFNTVNSTRSYSKYTLQFA